MPFGPGVHDPTYYIDETTWKHMYASIKRRFLYHMRNGTYDRDKIVEAVRADCEEMDKAGSVCEGRLPVKLKNPLTHKRVPPEWFADKAETLLLELEAMMWGAWREERNAWESRQRTLRRSGATDGYIVASTLDHIRQAGAQ